MPLLDIDFWFDPNVPLKDRKIMCVSCIDEERGRGIRQTLGSIYRFYSDGTPMEAFIFNTNRQMVGDAYKFFSNGKLQVKELRDRNGRMIERQEWDRQGSLLKHFRYENGRKHGYQIECTLITKEARKIWCKTTKEAPIVKHYYCHKGIEIPKRFVDKPDLITQKMIINCANVELRRVYIDLLGTEKFLDRIPHQIISQEGNDILMIGRVGEITIGIVKFICPSTGDIYFHGVPPSMKTVGEAKCWMFGLLGNTFDPIAEA